MGEDEGGGGGGGGVGGGAIGFILAGASVLVAPSAALASGARPGPQGFIGRFGSALHAISALQWGLVLLGVLSLALLWWRDVIRPGSLRETRVRKVVRGDLWVYAFGAVAVFLLSPVLATGFALVDRMGWLAGFGLGPNGREALATLVVYGLAIPLALGGVMLASRAAQPQQDDALGVVVRGSDFVRGAAGLVLILPLVLLTGIVVQVALQTFAGLTPDRLGHDTLRKLEEIGTGNWRWWALAAGPVIGAPIVEECLYRGLLQSAVVCVLHERWLSVLVTAGVFTLVHSNVPAYVLPLLFVLGVGLGVAFERTGRLWVCIAIHMGFNSFNLAVATWG